MRRASASFRPPAPPPSAYVTWPADFGQRYIITVDTEEEFDWSAPFSRDSRAVSAAAAIPPAAARFSDLGAPLTYLVDHPIATDPAAIAPIARALEDRRAAVGTQLHPWVSPPFDEIVSPANSFAGNLPRDLEAAKLDALTAAITEAFAVAPRIYRAGRYGLGPNTLELLAERGYRFDTSMRSRYDYSSDGGADYSAIGNHAFAIDGLIELPLTTVYTGAARALAPGLHSAARRIPRGLGLLARARLLNRVALTPEDMPLADALEAVRVVTGEGLALIALSFHSPSLVAGHTPYVRDAADLAYFWRWWTAVLDLLDRCGVRAASLDDLLTACEAPAPLVSGRSLGACSSTG